LYVKTKILFVKIGKLKKLLKPLINSTFYKEKNNNLNEDNSEKKKVFNLLKGRLLSKRPNMGLGGFIGFSLYKTKS